MKTATALGNWWLEASSQQCGLLMYHVLCRVFWPNIKSSRSLSPHTAQIWCPMTSGFSQNYNHLWKGIAFRLSMRFRKIQQDSWQWFQQRILQCFEQWKRHWENCVRSRGAYFDGTEASLPYAQCFLYLVASSINVSIFHSTWLDTFWADCICMIIYLSTWLPHWTLRPMKAEACPSYSPLYL